MSSISEILLAPEGSGHSKPDKWGLANQRESNRDQDGSSLRGGRQPSGCTEENASSLTLPPKLDSPQDMALSGYGTSGRFCFLVLFFF